MKEAGINSAEGRFENVYPYRPLDNDLEANVSRDEIDYWAVKLRDRLAAMPNLEVVVPLGNTALRAVTGLYGITDWRGSILQEPNQLCVIPSLHPAAVLRRPDWTGRCLSDWRKIKDQLDNPMGVPERHAIVLPTQADLDWFYEEATAGHPVAVDIETNHKTGDLICVGFAMTPDGGISILWNSKANKEAIRALCALPCPKVLHNALY